MRRPPILFTRPTYEWINQVAHKHREFVALEPSAEELEKLFRLIEIEFALGAFGLEGADLSEKQIEQLASLPFDNHANISEAEREAASQIEALRLIRALALSEGRNATLTPELLLRLRNPFGNAEFRKSPGDLSRSVKPASPQHLHARLQSAGFWFTAESFLELNPVEQAAIVLLRLIEIQPFENANDRMAITSASLFLMRSDLPPLIIRPDRTDSYRAAVEESFQSNTKPMVELVAQATEQTLARMIQSITQNR